VKYGSESTRKETTIIANGGFFESVLPTPWQFKEYRPFPQRRQKNQ